MSRGMLYLIIAIFLVGIVATFLTTRTPSSENETTVVVEKTKSELTGDKWVKNSLTRNIPEPTTGTLELGVQGKSKISFKVSDIDYNTYTVYVAQAKKMGYTINPNDSMGYLASNEDGYIIDISFEYGTMSVFLSN